MRIPTQKLLEAIAKKRDREGPSGGQQASAPKRPRKRALAAAPSIPEAAPFIPEVVPEIDLTADTPPDRGAVEGEVLREPAMEEGAAGEEPVIGEASAPDEPAIPETATDRGKRPLGAASPPPERSSTSGPRGATVEGGRARSRLSRESVLNDGHWAERLLSPVFVPEVMEELSQLKAGTFFRESYASIVRLANSLNAAREVIQGGKALLREAQKEAEDARCRAEVAEAALESARNAWATEMKAAENRAEVEANRSRAALNHMMEVEGAVAARDIHISELTQALCAVEEKAGCAEERARAAEEKAGSAEERARVAEEEMGRALEAERVALAALAAEEGTRAVEVETAVTARVAEAIENYKASEDFIDYMAEASGEVFLQGFQHGKEKFAREFNLPEALEMEPDRPSAPAPSDDDRSPADL